MTSDDRSACGCHDADATSFPGGDELPEDGIDQDCDGVDAIGEDTGDTDLPDDTDLPSDDTGDGVVDEEGGCGCGSTDIASAWALVLGVLALTARRRQAAQAAEATGRDSPPPGRPG